MNCRICHKPVEEDAFFFPQLPSRYLAVSLAGKNHRMCLKALPNNSEILCELAEVYRRAFSEQPNRKLYTECDIFGEARLEEQRLVLHFLPDFISIIVPFDRIEDLLNLPAGGAIELGVHHLYGASLDAKNRFSFIDRSSKAELRDYDESDAIRRLLWRFLTDSEMDTQGDC